MIRRYIHFFWTNNDYRHDELSEVSELTDLVWSRFVGFVVFPILALGILIGIIMTMILDPVFFVPVWGGAALLTGLWFILKAISKRDLEKVHAERRD